MANSESPSWFSLACFLFVVAVVALFSLLNSNTENTRPQKKFIERSYRSTGSGTKDAIESQQKTEENQPEEALDMPVEPIIELDDPKENDSTSNEEKTDDTYFSDLVGNYKKAVLSKLDRPESRTDVVVRYYTKEKDKKRVYVLRKYGFYIHERRPAEAFSDYASNALYFGDDVSNEDIQLVAYLLIQSGIELKKIVPSKLHDDWKANAIEIGTDSLATNLRPLGLTDLRRDWKVR